jgi:hypothetical protein
MTAEPASSRVTPLPAPPRVHKTALGFAVGVLVGSGVFLVTALHVALGLSAMPLQLLDNFFAGYEVSWRGAAIGLAWGFAVGFVDGWLLGFVHNFTVGFWMFAVRMREDFSRTRNFLDHI